MPTVASMVSAAIPAARILIAIPPITSGVTTALAPTRKTTVKPVVATANVPVATVLMECAVQRRVMLDVWPAAKCIRASATVPVATLMAVPIRITVAWTRVPPVADRTVLVMAVVVVPPMATEHRAALLIAPDITL